MKPVYVIGHRNPDTDSICSAIAYAYLKTSIGVNAIAVRSGNVNAETQFALKYFSEPWPKFVNDFYPRAKDIMVAPPQSVSLDDPLFKLGKILKESCIKSIPVINEKKQFKGIVSIGDLAKRFLDEMNSLDFKKTGTTFAAVAEVLAGKVLCGQNSLGKTVEGRLKIAGASLETIRNSFVSGDLVIVGDRSDVHELCLEIGVGAIIITGKKSNIKKSFIVKAEKTGIIIIHCAYDTYTCARLINQSIPAKTIMQTELVTFEPEDLLDDIKAEITSSHFRNYPVIKKGHLSGFITRNGLIMSEKQQVILVDHNELSQAAEGIENTKILEIIDHHRLGGMQTNEPIFIFQQPVGCTATIIYAMYQQHGIDVPPNMAGLLLSAILSDTVLFKSPTTTLRDKEVAMRLSQIAAVDLEEYGMDLLRSGASLTRQTPAEVIKQDLKEVHLGEYPLSISQVYVMDSNELFDLRVPLTTALEELRKKEGYALSLLLATNIITENTDMLVVGEPKKIAEQAFKQKMQNDILHLPGVMSRKKQVIPPIAAVIQEFG